MKFPSVTYFMTWVSDLIALPRSQIPFSKTPVLIKPILRNVLFPFVCFALFTAKTSNLSVTTVLWSLKDWKQTNRQKPFFLLRVMFIATRWWFPQGKHFCDPNWTPGAFSRLKLFRAVMWPCKRRMNLLALTANHKPEQIISPDNFQPSMLDKNVYI